MNGNSLEACSFVQSHVCCCQCTLHIHLSSVLLWWLWLISAGTPGSSCQMSKFPWARHWIVQSCRFQEAWGTVYQPCLVLWGRDLLWVTVWWHAFWKRLLSVLHILHSQENFHDTCLWKPPHNVSVSLYVQSKKPWWCHQGDENHLKSLFVLCETTTLHLPHPTRSISAAPASTLPSHIQTFITCTHMYVLTHGT